MTHTLNLNLEYVKTKAACSRITISFNFSLKFHAMKYILFHSVRFESIFDQTHTIISVGSLTDILFHIIYDYKFLKYYYFSLNFINFITL